MEAIKHGWLEYMQQPVLPASLAYVLLYFNVVLAPGGLMTAFLTQRGKYYPIYYTNLMFFDIVFPLLSLLCIGGIVSGLSPSIIGGFSGLCAFMGVAATFMSANMVKRLGILKVNICLYICVYSLYRHGISCYFCILR